MIGREIAHYRVSEKIGAGGMGEVYRASDTKLHRDVALKVLPELFAGDAERMARFEREAKVLASLNHPNIASIYGLEETEGTRCLVLELVEGETLQERLKSGDLTLEDSLGIARQIAEAFEAAHEKGIIHRDLKPANVKITPEGAVKVLDFGLAKALEGDSGAAPVSEISHSPTLTLAATQAGVVLGTAAYMSPEQARGRAADKRADIWSFGVVLYELLTHRQTFAGETISDTLASVLKVDPDWSALPAETPQPIRELLARCLEKDPRQRLRDVGEARITIERALRGDSSTIAGTGQVAAVVTEVPARPASKLPWIAALILVGVIAGAAGWLSRPAAPEPPVRRFAIPAQNLNAAYQRPPVISPDGRRIAYTTGSAVWIRDLDQVEPRELPETASASALFWSWDSQHLAFIADGKAWRIPATGGKKTAICDVPGTIDGGAWGPEDRILLAPRTGPMYEVPARGGDPKPFLDLVEGQESDFHKPHFLPEGRGILYGVHRTSQTAADTLEVLAGGERKVILRIEDHRLEHAHYSPTGHIVYDRTRGNDGIWAAPFDLDSLEITGESILIDPAGGTPSVSRDGSLVYRLGTVGAQRQLVWVNREGKELQAIGQPQTGMFFPDLSPDGRTVVVSADEDDSRDIWLHDVERGTRTRLTFQVDPEWAPFWSADGKRVYYTQGFGLDARILAKTADGTGEPVEITRGYLGNMAPDGATIAFQRLERETDDDIMFVAAEGGGEGSVFLSTPNSEDAPQISPDGKHLLYTSQESGQREIYLKAFPSGEGKWQVSVDGGRWARWSPSGDEIFYVSGQAMMSVEVRTEPTVRLGTPVELFSQGRTGYNIAGARQYDIHPDGQRFVVVKNMVEVDNVPTLIFVENWLGDYGEPE